MDQVTRSLVHVYCSSGMLPNKVLYTDITFTDARTGLQCHEYYIWKLHLAICKTYIILDKDMGNGEKNMMPVQFLSSHSLLSLTHSLMCFFWASVETKIESVIVSVIITHGFQKSFTKMTFNQFSNHSFNYQTKLSGV